MIDEHWGTRECDFSDWILLPIYFYIVIEAAPTHHYATVCGWVLKFFSAKKTIPWSSTFKMLVKRSGVQTPRTTLPRNGSPRIQPIGHNALLPKLKKVIGIPQLIDSLDVLNLIRLSKWKRWPPLFQQEFFFMKNQHAFFIPSQNPCSTPFKRICRTVC